MILSKQIISRLDSPLFILLASISTGCDHRDAIANGDHHGFPSPHLLECSACRMKPPGACCASLLQPFCAELAGSSWNAHFPFPSPTGRMRFPIYLCMSLASSCISPELHGGHEFCSTFSINGVPTLRRLLPMFHKLSPVHVQRYPDPWAKSSNRSRQLCPLGGEVWRLFSAFFVPHVNQSDLHPKRSFPYQQTFRNKHAASLGRNY